MTRWNPDHYKAVNIRLPVVLKNEIHEELKAQRCTWQDFILAAALAYKGGEWEMPNARILAAEEAAWLDLTGGAGKHKTIRDEDE